MAQLPPKFPSSAASPWLAEEFFDFSSTKRGAHRRVMSDSGTTFEDELLQNSMFSEDVRLPSSGPASAAPSTPSDHNSSINEQADMLAPPSSGNDLAEVQSACNAMDSAHVDPKRVRRILANRQSAQRSRVRKLQYISELERSVTTLQTEVSALSPRVAFLDQQRTVLSVGNSNLKQRIAALAYDNLFKDARQEMLQNELERLRKLYHQQQNLKKLPAVAADYDPSSEH